MNKKTQSVFRITLTATLSALAFALMFVEFPIPALIPPFIKFDISDLPALFGAFFIGPVYGVIVELIKNLLHIIIKGTSSAYIGELSNFLLGASLCLTSGFIYKFKKTKGGAIIACIAGALIMGVISLPINYFLVYPAYVKFYHFPLVAIIGAYQEILGSIATKPTTNSLFNCLLVFNVPFTAAKGIIDAIICIIVYKPLSKVLKSLNGKKADKAE